MDLTEAKFYHKWLDLYPKFQVPFNFKDKLLIGPIITEQAHHFSWHVWCFPSSFHSAADRRLCSPELHIPPRWTAAVCRMSRRSRLSGRCCPAHDAPSRWSWCSGHSEHIWCRISWGKQQKPPTIYHHLKLQRSTFISVLCFAHY